MCIRDRLYTMQRYLQYERLQELNMTHFDCWASRFGETVTALELGREKGGTVRTIRFAHQMKKVLREIPVGLILDKNRTNLGQNRI